MAWRFRKVFKLFPGVKLNVSRSGVSASVGGAPLTMNFGSRGPQATLGVPGTGVSIRVPLGGRGGDDRHRPAAPPASPVATPDPGLAEIRSLPVELLQGGRLDGYRQVLEEAATEAAQIRGQIETLGPVAERSRRRAEWWRNGWLFRRLFPRKMAAIAANAEEDKDRLDELREQLSLCRVPTEVDATDAVRTAFADLVHAFTVMARAAAKWDVVAAGAVNQSAERSVATSRVDRKPVTFALAEPETVAFSEPVPRLGNANGSDLQLYPGFALLQGKAIAVFDARELSISFAGTRFHEDQLVPHDSVRVGTTWLKANKDGSPDRRFRDNRELPVMRYGEITVRAANGVNEVWLISNAESAEAFVAAWQRMQRAVGEA